MNRLTRNLCLGATSAAAVIVSASVVTLATPFVVATSTIAILCAVTYGVMRTAARRQFGVARSARLSTVNPRLPEIG